MKKENVVKFLAFACLLIPGNLKSRKTWFLSFTSFLSLIALLFSIGALVVEVIGYKDFANAKLTNEVYKKLEHKPIRPVAFCLKPEKLVEYLNGNADTGNSSGVNPKAAGSKHHKPGLLEDIVSTAYRLLIFGVNILVRIFIWISFTAMIDLLTSTFSPQEGRSNTQNRFLANLWYSSAQKWSSSEKTFLFIICFSQLLKEVSMITQFNSSISNTGVELLDMTCIFVQIIAEQARAQFTRELVMEVSTFALIITMKTFENVLATIAGQSDEDSEMEYDSKDFASSDDAQSNADEKITEDRSEGHPDILFVKTQAMLLKTEMSRKAAKGRILSNGMNSNYDHVSEIVGGYDNHPDPDLSLIFQPSKDKQISGEYPNGEDQVDLIYSQMNFIISMYFELMTLWERAGRLTGFITLLLFCELTTTFCFNTYITLDISMEFGLMSVLGILGLFKGVVIVTKFVCVCNSAQSLRDMTPILLDRVLKLKLKLLSLPSECYIKRANRSGLSGEYRGSMAPYECERCRGLGSFLSEMVSYIRGHPFELSALGYFTVSRSTLTTITGVIVTYLVVLVQFQSYSSV